MGATEKTDKKDPWLRKALVEGTIAGVVAPIVVVVLVTAMSGFLQDRFREPTCDDPKDLRPVKALEVTASGDPDNPRRDGQLTYPAVNATDSNSGTAWVESAAGYGIGEWLEFTLPENTDLQMICIVNGYARSAELYQNNGRVRQFEVSTDAGSKDVVVADAPLDQISSFQKLEPPQGRTDRVRLTIRSTATLGGVNPVEDTSISEVEFWAR